MIKVLDRAFETYSLYSEVSAIASMIIEYGRALGLGVLEQYEYAVQIAQLYSLRTEIAINGAMLENLRNAQAGIKVDIDALSTIGTFRVTTIESSKDALAEAAGIDTEEEEGTYFEASGKVTYAGRLGNHAYYQYTVTVSANIRIRDVTIWASEDASIFDNFENYEGFDLENWKPNSWSDALQSGIRGNSYVWYDRVHHKQSRPIVNVVLRHDDGYVVKLVL